VELRHLLDSCTQPQLLMNCYLLILVIFLSTAFNSKNIVLTLTNLKKCEGLHLYIPLVLKCIL